MFYRRQVDPHRFLWKHDSDYIFAVKNMLENDLENNKLFTAQKYRVRLNIARKNVTKSTVDFFL